jgi:hypothetical protein
MFFLLNIKKSIMPSATYAITNEGIRRFGDEENARHEINHILNAQARTVPLALAYDSQKQGLLKNVPHSKPNTQEYNMTGFSGYPKSTEDQATIGMRSAAKTLSTLGYISHPIVEPLYTVDTTGLSGMLNRFLPPGKQVVK